MNMQDLQAWGALALIVIWLASAALDRAPAPEAECLTDAECQVQHEGRVWYVVADGGMWWPDEGAQAEIDAMPDPAAHALWLSETAPERGEWWRVER